MLAADMTLSEKKKSNTRLMIPPPGTSLARWRVGASGVRQRMYHRESTELCRVSGTRTRLRDRRGRQLRNFPDSVRIFQFRTRRRWRFRATRWARRLLDVMA